MADDQRTDEQEEREAAVIRGSEAMSLITGERQPEEDDEASNEDAQQS
jgi:hypothetical protein